MGSVASSQASHAIEDIIVQFLRLQGVGPAIFVERMDHLELQDGVVILVILTHALLVDL